MANHVVDHWCRAQRLADRAPTERLRRMFVRLVGAGEGRAFVKGCTRCLWALWLRNVLRMRAECPYSEN